MMKGHAFNFKKLLPDISKGQIYITSVSCISTLGNRYPKPSSLILFKLRALTAPYNVNNILL